MELLPYVWNTEEMFVIRARGRNMAGHSGKLGPLKSGAYLKIFHGYISDRLCKPAKARVEIHLTLTRPHICFRTLSLLESKD